VPRSFPASRLWERLSCEALINNAAKLKKPCAFDGLGELSMSLLEAACVGLPKQKWLLEHGDR
jgi:hypothetical protein